MLLDGKGKRYVVGRVKVERTEVAFLLVPTGVMDE